MRQYRWLAVVVVLGLVAAACSRSSSSSSGDNSTTSSSAASQAKNPNFGSVKDVCQSGHPSGSPTQGVTPTYIKIGDASPTPASPAGPGLDQEFFDTADVFAEVVQRRAVASTGARSRSTSRTRPSPTCKARMTEACADDFSMVGGGVVFDQDGVDDPAQVPAPRHLGLRREPAGARRRPRGAAGPEPELQHSADRRLMNYLGEKFPAATTTSACSPATSRPPRSWRTSRRTSGQGLGWKMVYNDAYPAAGRDRLDAVRAEDQGATGSRGLIWVGEPENLAELMKSLSEHRLQARLHPHRRQPLRPEAHRRPPAPRCPKTTCTSAARSTRSRRPAPSNATGQYLDAFKKYKPNGKSTHLPRPAGVVGVAAVRHRPPRRAATT